MQRRTDLRLRRKRESVVLAIHASPPKSLALHDALFKSMDSLTHADSQL